MTSRITASRAATPIPNRHHMLWVSNPQTPESDTIRVLQLTELAEPLDDRWRLRPVRLQASTSPSTTP